MKFILTCSVLIAIITNAQINSSSQYKYGVYKTGNDFSNGIISYGFDKPDAKHKLKNEVTHHIYVVNNDSSYLFNYTDIWGIKNNNGDWRLYNNKLYKVVDTAKVYVYIRPTRQDFSQPGLTKFQTTYFSVTPGGNLYQLTRDNLLTAFKNDANMVNKLNSMSSSAVVDKKDKHTGKYEFISWL